jgi:outer membrane protein OmpA-like peptidoglycan-associated protein
MENGSSNNVLILVEGQCDERGTDEYNMALGDRRARATMNYLAALGIATNRMSTVSYGKKQPRRERRSVPIAAAARGRDTRRSPC